MHRPLAAFLLALSALGCRGDQPPPGPTATVSSLPPSTSTTTRDLTALEAEVEAAYLRSWEVYAHAALELTTDGLEESYTGRALDVVRADVERFKRNGTRARFSVVHAIDIEVRTSTTAIVRDSYTNHSVLLDMVTRAALEPDPNQLLHERYLLIKEESRWLVAFIERA